MRMILILLLNIVIVFPFNYCDKKPDNNDENGDNHITVEPIEPEMILINENLTFHYGPTWMPDYKGRLVTLAPYYIGKYELTIEEYGRFVKDGGYDNPELWSEEGWNSKITENWTGPLYWGDSDEPWLDDIYSDASDKPVHGISYYEANAYCSWLSSKTGKNYYIPTSEQWQRTAKGPDPGTKYTWGNDWIDGMANYVLFREDTLTSVDSYHEGKSSDGCLNMIGNAYEITTYFYLEEIIVRYYSAPAYEASVIQQMKETMTTNRPGLLDNDSRRHGVGLRLCREF
jgi:formylglycine-generating enzyme required for sulfatase activity